LKQPKNSSQRLTSPDFRGYQAAAQLKLILER